MSGESVITSNEIEQAAVPMTELEVKRQAVLASMKRKAAARSRASSESPKVPSTPTLANINPNLINDYQPTLKDAVVDLRSLGYTFEMILEKSETSRQFLENCFKRWNFPVPIRPVERPVVQPRPKHIQHQPSSSSSISMSSVSHSYSKPLFANKVYRPNEQKPDWLKGLVIDLDSSSDESGDESDDESSDESTEKDQQETKSESDDPAQKETVDINNEVEDDGYDPEDIPTKKRKISNEVRYGNMSLGELKCKKAELKTRIEEISGQVESTDRRTHEIKVSMEELKDLVREKEARVTTFRNLVSSLESEIQRHKDALSSLALESSSLPDSRAEMAKCLIEMDHLEAEEERLKEADRKRIALRNKLLKQMEKNRIKKEEEKIQQQQSLSPASLTSQQETENAESNTAEEHQSDTYDETIHKIPKAQASQFTPYKSLGLTKKVTNKNDDNDMLCPLELVNGTCTDKGCQLKHLAV